MEKAIDVLFTQEIFNRFIESFQVKAEVKKLGDFENYVFEVYDKENAPFILRITHSSHRNKDEIVAELDWMDYLYRNGISCPKAFPSFKGELIEQTVANDGSLFFACKYSKAAGKGVRVNSKEFNEQLFFAWGKAIGKMHAVTKHYRPKDGIKLRPFWYEEELLDVNEYFPHEEKIIENTNELLMQLRQIPRTANNFGLIHSDIHSGNFFYDGEKVNVFDFDDCSYHWFASDIAITLYYSIYSGYMKKSKDECTAFASRFLTHFINGYQESNTLPENWRTQLPLFLMLRDITLYSVLHKKIAPEDRDERLTRNMELIRQRIIQKEPIVQLKE